MMNCIQHKGQFFACWEEELIKTHHMRIFLVDISKEALLFWQKWISIGLLSEWLYAELLLEVALVGKQTLRWSEILLDEEIQ